MRPRTYGAALEGLAARVVPVATPASARKLGLAGELAAAVLERAGPAAAEELGRSLLFADVGADGALRPVRGAILAAEAARDRGLRLIVSPANGPEGADVPGADVRQAATVDDVVRALECAGVLERAEAGTRQREPSAASLDALHADDPARRALEVAAAGGHGVRVLFPEPAHAGRVAGALLACLPELAPSEALALTRVHSVAGLLGPGRTHLRWPALRDVHHTVPEGELCGSDARPGLVAVVHAGVLVLKDVPEFRRYLLERLARVIEAGRIEWRGVELAARPHLVATVPPCPCGRDGDPIEVAGRKPCTCTPMAAERHRGRVAPDLMELLDVGVQLAPRAKAAPPLPGEPAETVRARVAAVRALQLQRYGGPIVNAWSELAPLVAAGVDDEAHQALRSAPPRLVPRVLRVARTVADLEGSVRVRARHVAEALALRPTSPGAW